MNEEYTCPECGSHKTPKVTKVNENTDADGNRGMLVKYIECRDCGYEESMRC